MAFSDSIFAAHSFGPVMWRSEERRVGKECGCQLSPREATDVRHGSIRLIRVGVASFFFQAEDGIRDKLVTGVQTCALPISDRGVARQERGRHGGRDAGLDASAAGPPTLVRPGWLSATRSSRPIPSDR